MEIAPNMNKHGLLWRFTPHGELRVDGEPWLRFMGRSKSGKYLIQHVDGRRFDMGVDETFVNQQKNLTMRIERIRGQSISVRIRCPSGVLLSFVKGKGKRRPNESAEQ